MTLSLTSLVKLGQRTPEKALSVLPHPVLKRLKFSAIFLRRLIRWPSFDIQVKFSGDRLRGTPPSGELTTRGVAEYSDLGLIERYISETVQDMSYVTINH